MGFIHDMRIGMLVDPANAKNKRSDFTVMWVFGLHLDHNVYIIDGRRDKLDQNGRWLAAYELHQKWNPVSRVRCVAWEQYGLQTDISYIKEKQQEHNYRFDIKPVGGNIRKEDRIRGLTGMFNDGQIIFVDEIPITTLGESRNLTKDFVDLEYTKYPAVRTDDMLDALARVRDVIDLKYVTFPTKPKQDTSDFYRRRHERLEGTSWMGR
jgi:hypothetical protein